MAGNCLEFFETKRNVISKFKQVHSLQYLFGRNRIIRLQRYWYYINMSTSKCCLLLIHTRVAHSATYRKIDSTEYRIQESVLKGPKTAKLSNKISIQYRQNIVDNNIQINDRFLFDNYSILSTLYLLVNLWQRYVFDFLILKKISSTKNNSDTKICLIFLKWIING